jgi:ADP-heptose:LPS heptosyltransferase
MIDAGTPGDLRFVELGKNCVRTGVGENLVDALDVKAAARTIAESMLYIGPDSGLVHLAAAVGTPAVGLYGPVDPHRAFGPRSTLHPVISPAQCRACWTDGRMKTPGNCPLGISGESADQYPCMREITADMVWATIRDKGLLSRE